jgi:hypothetical protein
LQVRADLRTKEGLDVDGASREWKHDRPRRTLNGFEEVAQIHTHHVGAIEGAAMNCEVTGG